MGRHRREIRDNTLCCSSCKKWLAFDDFFLCRSAATGRSAKCRKCVRMWKESNGKLRPRPKYEREIIDGKFSCRTCLSWKDPAEFYVKSDHPSGRMTACKVCDEAKNKAARKKKFVPRPDIDYTSQSSGQPPKKILRGRFRCGSCQTFKPVNQFDKDARTRTGLSNTCKECRSAYYKKRLIEDPEFKSRRKASSKAWAANNRPRIYQTRRANIQTRIGEHLRSALSNAIRAKQVRPKGPDRPSAVRHLGCSIAELIQHIERLWQVGMSWENYSFRGWHIDHVIPLDAFDLTKDDHIKAVVHFTNLQPLWWDQNLAKGDSLPEGFDLEAFLAHDQNLE